MISQNQDGEEGDEYHGVTHFRCAFHNEMSWNLAFIPFLEEGPFLRLYQAAIMNRRVMDFRLNTNAAAFSH